MLLLMMELKGKFNAKMIKKAKFGEQYFDDMGAFESIERDRVSGSVSTLLPTPFHVNSSVALGRIPESSYLQTFKRPTSTIAAAFCEDRR